MTRNEAIHELIFLFTGKEPPFPITVDRLNDLPDDDFQELQGFMVTHARATWLSGIGIMEAIDTLIYEAIDNNEAAFDRAPKSKNLRTAK